jgi:hypothetical protein
MTTFIVNTHSTEWLEVAFDSCCRLSPKKESRAFEHGAVWLCTTGVTALSIQTHINSDEGQLLFNS